MLHHLDADVAHVFVGQQRVQIVDDAGEDVAQDGNSEFGNHQPPQPMRNGLMFGEDADDGIDDQLADVKQGYRLQRGQQAEDKAENHDDRAGIPDEFEHRREVAHRRHALLPRTGKGLLALAHWRFRSNPEICHPAGELHVHKY